MFYKLAFFSLSIVLLLSCGGNGSSLIAGDSDLADNQNQDIALLLFHTFHQLSEHIYDGSGTWGETTYGYRMALRDSYWRGYIYNALGRTNHPQAGVFLNRTAEVVQFLLVAQYEGESGVFGFPADTANPEFGERVSLVVQDCPECVHNGWIISLPGTHIEELYFDHGYALVTLSQAYKFNPDADLLSAIITGADWIFGKPISDNINYVSALIKGLCYSYEVTADQRYLEKAIELHELGIAPFLFNGQALDKHNALLEYHGFIVSGLIALRKVLPASHRLSVSLDRQLNEAVFVMTVNGMKKSGNYGETWLGTNLIAWHELAQLRDLSSEEQATVNRIIRLAENQVELIKNETNGFRLQKALYTYFSIGLYIN